MKPNQTIKPFFKVLLLPNNNKNQYFTATMNCIYTSKRFKLYYEL